MKGVSLPESKPVDPITIAVRIVWITHAGLGSSRAYSIEDVSMCEPLLLPQRRFTMERVEPQHHHQFTWIFDISFLPPLVQLSNNTMLHGISITPQS